MKVETLALLWWESDTLADTYARQSDDNNMNATMGAWFDHASVTNSLHE